MRLQRITLLLLFTTALLSGIALFNATFFNRVMDWTTPVNTVILFAFAILHGWQRLGWKRILLLFAAVTIISLAFESVGVATGVIYGPYHYTDMLGPKLFGLVPVLIPMAWFMMMYASYLIADLTIPPDYASPAGRRLLLAAVGGIVMTAWDLAMDPMMVAGGHWVWQEPGAFFGIPLQNFWGWWLTTFTALAVYLILEAVLIRTPAPKADIPLVWAIYAYAITALSTVWVDFLFGMSGPALTGLFAMLPWVIIGLVLSRRKLPPAGTIRSQPSG